MHIRLLLASTFFFALANGALADESAITAISARLSALQNFSARYSEVDDYTPPAVTVAQAAKDSGKLPTGVTAGLLRQGMYSHDDDVSFLNGQVILDSSLSPDTWASKFGGKATDSMRRTIWSSLNGRAENLSWGAKGQPEGAIMRNRPLPEEFTIDLALGIRLWGDNQYLTLERLKSLKVLSSSDEMVTTDYVGPTGMHHQWQFDPKKGFALAHYSLIDSNRKCYLEVSCSDFRQEGNVVLPASIVRRNYYIDKGGESSVAILFELKVNDFKLPDPKNDPNHFLIQWPKGASVWDSRVDFELDSGEVARAWTDSEIADEVNKHDQQQTDMEARAKALIGQVQGNASKMPTTKP